LTLEDVLSGVLGFDLATRDGGAAAAQSAAVQLGRELGWPEAQVARAAAAHVAATARAASSISALGA